MAKGILDTVENRTEQLQVRVQSRQKAIIKRYAKLYGKSLGVTKAGLSPYILRCVSLSKDFAEIIEWCLENEDLIRGTKLQIILRRILMTF